MNEVVSVKNVRVKLDGRTVIDNLSFEIESGDGLAIIGPNGSGKTVLLKTLLGLIPYEGGVEWQPDMRIGYVPQKIDADRHLPLNLKNLLIAKEKALGLKASLVDVASDVGLPKASLETPIGHLSGGQFQRALIAFALLGKPNVLLLDEPTASIDLPGEEKIYELIHRLQDKYHMTIILVSHDLSFVYRYATKVLCLNKTGLCFGTPEEALNPQTLEKLYGGPQKYFHHLH
ncbi:MAG: metal ABC transporter ATP-binding protein [Candidatus Liptonbacteria bacterium]|nr:metal ABC transporter ATP-binding protein [Candidatus Liptonbacteria bacterium]